MLISRVLGDSDYNVLKSDVQPTSAYTRELMWTDHFTFLGRSFRKVKTAIIATIICTNLVMCHWDIRLSCPETWFDKDMITLVCEISKQRLNSCTTKIQHTEFRLENNNPSTQMCNVDPNGYEKCNQAIMPSVSQCVCYDNITYFSLKYKFIADKSMHNGTWDCDRSCFDEPFRSNILVKNNSQYCSNVKVLDRGENKTNEAPTITITLLMFGVVWILYW